jgi:hypothetical protein
MVCLDEPSHITREREVPMKKRSQLTLAGTGFEKYTKVTRRAQFLAEMERVVPWQRDTVILNNGVAHIHRRTIHTGRR